MSSSSKKTMRNPLETRQKILETAFLEIYCHGYKGTSTNAIINKLEMTRGAFFHHFPTKNDLGYAIIEEVLADKIMERWIWPIEASANPIIAILDNFAARIDEHREEHILCGCPLNNLVQEMSDKPDFHNRIQAVMEMWVKKTQALLTKAKRSGFLRKEINTRQLAEFIVACEEAAFSMGKAFNSRAAMRSNLKSLKHYIFLLNSA